MRDRAESVDPDPSRPAPAWSCSTALLLLILAACGGESSDPPPEPEALRIATTTLPDGQIGVAYNTSLVARRGDTEVAAMWSVANGALPTGVTLTGGRLAGTPSATGTFQFSLTASDQHDQVEQSLSLAIQPATPTGGSLSFVPAQALPFASVQIVGLPSGAGRSTVDVRFDTLLSTAERDVTGAWRTPVPGGLTAGPHTVTIVVDWGPTPGTTFRGAFTVQFPEPATLANAITTARAVGTSAVTLADQLEHLAPSATAVSARTQLLRRAAQAFQAGFDQLSAEEQQQMAVFLVTFGAPLADIVTAFQTPVVPSARTSPRVQIAAVQAEDDCMAQLATIERIKRLQLAIGLLEGYAKAGAQIAPPVQSALALLLTTAAKTAELAELVANATRRLYHPTGLTITATPAMTYDDGGEVSLAARLRLQSNIEADPSIVTGFLSGTSSSVVPQLLEQLTTWPYVSEVAAILTDVINQSSRTAADFIASVAGSPEVAIPFSAVSLNPLTTADPVAGPDPTGRMRVRPLAADDREPIPVTLESRTGTLLQCRATSGPSVPNSGQNGFRVQVGYLDLPDEATVEIDNTDVARAVLRRGDGAEAAASDWRWESVIANDDIVAIVGGASQLPPVQFRGVAPGQTTLTIRATRADVIRTRTVSIRVPGAVVNAHDKVLLVREGNQQTIDLDAEVRDSRGRPVNAPVLWASSNPDGLSMTRDGIARGERDGRYLAIARSGDVADTTLVDVGGPLSGVWSLTDVTTWSSSLYWPNQCTYQFVYYVIQTEAVVSSVQEASATVACNDGSGGAIPNQYAVGGTVAGNMLSFSWNACRPYTVPIARAFSASGSGPGCTDALSWSISVQIAPFPASYVLPFARTAPSARAGQLERPRARR